MKESHIIGMITAIGEEEEIVKLTLPYGWDGIVVNVPGYLAGLPQDAWMTEFVSAPEPETAGDEEVPDEDDVPMGDF